MESGAKYQTASQLGAAMRCNSNVGFFVLEIVSLSYTTAYCKLWDIDIKPTLLRMSRRQCKFCWGLKMAIVELLP